MSTPLYQIKKERLLPLFFIWHILHNLIQFLQSATLLAVALHSLNDRLANIAIKPKVVFKDTAHILPYDSCSNKYPVFGCFCIAVLFVGSSLRSAGSEYIVNESVRFGSLQLGRIFHNVRSYNNCLLF